MNILIGGATGLIGSALVQYLQEHHSITVLGRDTKKMQAQFPSLPRLSWNSLSAPDLKIQDIVINLAGENIGEKNWSARRKEQILNSRIETSSRLNQICLELNQHAPRLINASAIGIYGPQSAPYSVADETTPISLCQNNFSNTVCYEWEQALLPAINNNTAVIFLRLGVVLSTQGGALTKMLPSFKLGMGAVIGDGSQPFSWISLHDAVRAISFLINRPDIAGPVNLVANHQTTQRQLAYSLATKLNRPCFLTLPQCVITTLFGQMGNELLLQGVQVQSTRLLEAGFTFDHPNLDNAWPSIGL